MDSSDGTKRRLWSDTRRRKEPSLYDEWLSQEKSAPQIPSTPPRGPATLLRNTGDAASSPPASGTTVRSVTPDTDRPSSPAPGSAGRRINSPANFLFPHTRSNRPADPASPSSASARSRAIPQSTPADSLSWRQEAHIASHSPSGSRNGTTMASLLGRKSSKGDKAPANVSTAGGSAAGFQDRGSQLEPVTRPRMRTLEDGGRSPSPARVLKKHHRGASINVASRAAREEPAATAVSVSEPASNDDGHQKLSSPASQTDEDRQASEKSQGSQAKRILNLMRTLNGRMSGIVAVRRHVEGHWGQSHCYIHDQTGALMYEPKGGDGAPRTLVPDLRGCHVRPRMEGEMAYLELNLAKLDKQLHVRPLTQSEFDGWYAAFLYWLDPDHEPPLPDSRSSSSALEDVSRRADSPSRTSLIDRSRRPGSTRSDASRDGRRSVVSSLKDAPVIKIGKMIFWETGADLGASAAAAQVPAARPAVRRTQSMRSRRWRRISAQLRESGELKLHTDSDNSLLSVVQLSQLSRCAIQRLDQSVLEVEFCLAIYPQYTSSSVASQPGFNRPIFLSLEDRVLYEVWFVLLRAFAIPQLYGSRVPTSATEGDDELEASEDIEEMTASSTVDMFRMERTLTIRIVEAKMHPIASNGSSETSFNVGYGKGGAKTESFGYYAEVLLDGETRGKTIVKFEGSSPLWTETFQYPDLPPVLNSANVVIKRRPYDHVHERLQYESRLGYEAYGASTDQQGGFTGFSGDVACGSVEIYLPELEQQRDVEKYWPVINSYNHHVGEVLIKARTDETVILMARDYEPLADLLHRFANSLTIQVAQVLSSDLKRVSECFVNIFQVSGQAGDWLMSLIEEEIDGVHKETPASRLRYNETANDGAGAAGAATSARDVLVRDMNKNATLEANLLFRGNTLLTKSLDAYMRRVGKEFLEQALANKLRDINDMDPDCEVDPNRVSNPQELDRNWRRLLLLTQEVWTTIVAARHRCPVELRVIFKHIRACAEDRYGDFLRSVSFSSVSGFLFLRFFCPAILNPQLFGLLNDEIRPKARRTFILIAKSIQTLANLASFGTKETWMEPMNAFLTQHREGFKAFVNDICAVPGSTGSRSSAQPPIWPPGVVSAETHLSYTTPTTIMQRLPSTSREGFPSLPYLIDQSRAYAELVQIWLESTTKIARAEDGTHHPQLSRELMTAMRAADGDLLRFHETCASLHARTQECLSRAERAERPNSALSFQWDQLIDQLQPPPAAAADLTSHASSFEDLAEHIASDPSIIPLPSPPFTAKPRDWSAAGTYIVKNDAVADPDDESTGTATQLVEPETSTATPAKPASPPLEHFTALPASTTPAMVNAAAAAAAARSSDRPWSSSGKAARLAQVLARPISRPASAGGQSAASSSAQDSDAERNAPLSAFQRREQRREVATRKALLIGAGGGQEDPAEAAELPQSPTDLEGDGNGKTNPKDKDKDKEKEKDKDKKRRVKTPIVAALRKTRTRDSDGKNGGSSSGGGNSNGSSASRLGSYNGRGIRGVDMSFV